jgi:hypothetical protein
VEIDVPDGIIAPGLSSHLDELIAVVGLRGGSRVTGGLSARGLANVAVRDWSDDFTFIIGNRRYRCRSSVAPFLSPRVSKLHLIDTTISELRLEVEDRDNFFSSVLEAGGGGCIPVDSTLTLLSGELGHELKPPNEPRSAVNHSNSLKSMML